MFDNFFHEVSIREGDVLSSVCHLSRRLVNNLRRYRLGIIEFSYLFRLYFSRGQPLEILYQCIRSVLSRVSFRMLDRLISNR